MIYLILLFPMLFVIIQYWKRHSIGNIEMLEKLMTKEEFKKFKKDLSKLKEKGCDKSAVEKSIQTDFRKLNERFVNFLEAIDGTLYHSMLDACDQCRDKIVSNIGDDGVNLWVDEKYKDLIMKPLDDTKKKMLSQLFNYRGE